MTAAIGVLLVMGGVSVTIIGLIRYFFPASNRLVPADLDRWFSLKFAPYYLLAGLLLLLI